MAELVLRIRDREMSRVGITKSRVTLGRDAASDLVIDNAGVSRTHAVVTYSAGSYSVRDEGSQNGILVNGKRVKKAVLAYGDIIGVGKFEIEIVESDHEPFEETEQPAPQVAKSVMKTMQMDAGSMARMRDEAIARIKAQKAAADEPPPPYVPNAPAAPARQPAAKSSRGPARPYSTAAVQAPAPAAGMSTAKLVLIIAASVVAGGVLVKLLLGA